MPTVSYEQKKRELRQGPNLLDTTKKHIQIVE